MLRKVTRGRASRFFAIVAPSVTCAWILPCATLAAAILPRAAFAAPLRPFDDCAPSRQAVHWTGELTFDPTFPFTDPVLDVVTWGNFGCAAVGERLIFFTHEPPSPSIAIATLSPGIGGGVDLLIEDNLLYVGTLRWRGSFFLGALLVVDVADPRNPRVVGEVSHPRFGSPVILAKSGDRLLLERPSDFFPTLFVVDVTLPVAPRVLHVEEQPADHRWLSLAPLPAPASSLAWALVRGEGLRLVDLSSLTPEVLEPFLPGTWDRFALAPSGRFGVLAGPNPSTRLRWTLADLSDAFTPKIGDELDPVLPETPPTFWSRVRELVVTNDLAALAWDRGVFLARPRENLGRAGARGGNLALEDCGYIRAHVLATDLAITADQLLIGDNIRGVQFYDRREDVAVHSRGTFREALPEAQEMTRAAQLVEARLYVARFVKDLRDPYYGDFRETHTIDVSHRPFLKTYARYREADDFTWAGARDLAWGRGLLWAWRGRSLDAVDVSGVSPTLVTSVALDPPGVPNVIGRMAFAGTQLLLVVDGDPEGQLSIFDIESPKAPHLQHAIDVPTGARAVVAKGDWAYIAFGASGIAVVELASNPPSVRRVVGIPEPQANAGDLEIYGSTLLVAANEADLVMFDLRDPANPENPRRIDLPRAAFDVAVHGQLAYVACGEAGVAVVDLFEEAAPRYLGTVACGIDPTRVVVDAEGPIALDAANGIEILRPDCAATLREVDDAEVPGSDRLRAELQLRVTSQPARGQVKIEWTRDAAEVEAQMTLEIYDVRGRRLRRLEARDLTRGGARTRELLWDGRDEGGNAVGSGVYFAVRGGGTGDSGTGARFVFLR